MPKTVPPKGATIEIPKTNAPGARKTPRGTRAGKNVRRTPVGNTYRPVPGGQNWTHNPPPRLVPQPPATPPAGWQQPQTAPQRNPPPQFPPLPPVRLSAPPHVDSPHKTWIRYTCGVNHFAADGEPHAQAAPRARPPPRHGCA